MLSTQAATYNFPTDIHFGPGARKQLADTLKTRGLNSPLIVTDSGVRELDWFHVLRTQLQSEGLRVTAFSEISGNPVESQVTAGVEAYRQHEADSIVAVGGGAATDVAKAIALMVQHPGALFDYADDASTPLPIEHPIPYLAALPTTAGTGSEVGRSFVVSDDRTHVKKIIGHPSLLPQTVFADPELLVGLPPHLTAATGMDALSHLVEAYLAKGMQPLCDGIALEGVYLLSRSLVPCYQFAEQRDPGSESHIAARGAMLNASMMGAVAFQKGLGLTHSMAHALSTVCDLHHGLAIGILLPTTMAYYASACEHAFTRLAQVASVEPHNPSSFLYWLRTLRSEVEIPDTLREVHVTEAHIEALVSHAWADPCHRLGPRSVDENDLERLFLEALG